MAEWELKYSIMHRPVVPLKYNSGESMLMIESETLGMVFGIGMPTPEFEYRQEVRELPASDCRERILFRTRIESGSILLTRSSGLCSARASA